MFEFLKKIIKKDSPEKKSAEKKEVAKKPQKKGPSALKQKVSSQLPKLLKKNQLQLLKKK
jgi:hypothetical protein